MEFMKLKIKVNNHEKVIVLSEEEETQSIGAVLTAHNISLEGKNIEVSGTRSKQTLPASTTPQQIYKSALHRWSHSKSARNLLMTPSPTSETVITIQLNPKTATSSNTAAASHTRKPPATRFVKPFLMIYKPSEGEKITITIKDFEKFKKEILRKKPDTTIRDLLRLLYSQSVLPTDIRVDSGGTLNTKLSELGKIYLPTLTFSAKDAPPAVNAIDKNDYATTLLSQMDLQSLTSSSSTSAPPASVQPRGDRSFLQLDSESEDEGSEEERAASDNEGEEREEKKQAAASQEETPFETPKTTTEPQTSTAESILQELKELISSEEDERLGNIAKANFLQKIENLTLTDSDIESFLDKMPKEEFKKFQTDLKSYNNLLRIFNSPDDEQLKAIIQQITQAAALKQQDSDSILTRVKKFFSRNPQENTSAATAEASSSATTRAGAGAGAGAETQRPPQPIGVEG